tara:strand:- start:4 stop:165 length:162 start_codon:yes stop_codon:yes gene_type:complete
MTYKPITNLANEHFIIRLTDGAWIPVNEGNTDYQEYLEWLAQGNEPLPADEEE